MRYVRWSERYTLAQPVLDGQHRSLVTALNDLCACVIQRACPAAVLGLVDQLEILARTHFSDEEKHMQDAGFPALIEHQAEHAAFLDMLNGARKALVGDPCDSEGFLSGIRMHLLGHMEHADRRFAQFVQDREPRGRMLARWIRGRQVRWSLLSFAAR